MKSQKSFIVERKLGRRRVEVRAKSIWGDTDLKAIARKAEVEAPHLFAPTGEIDILANEGANSAPANPVIETTITSRSGVPTESSLISVENLENEPVEAAAPPAVTPRLEPAMTVDARISLGLIKQRKARNSSQSLAVKNAVFHSVAGEASDEELARLEEENRELKHLLSRHLSDQNIQLRQMLVRFGVS